MVFCLALIPQAPAAPAELAEEGSGTELAGVLNAMDSEPKEATMGKKGMVFCLALLSMLAAVAVPAEEVAAPGSSPTLLPLFTTSPGAPGVCKAAPLSKAQVPSAPAVFEGNTDGASREACEPAECGQGAAVQGCSSTCCRYKCCIC